MARFRLYLDNLAHLAIFLHGHSIAMYLAY